MNEDLGTNEKGSVGRRVAANTGLMVAAKLSAALIGLTSLILLTRNLPIGDVGILLFLHAYMLLFAEVATFQSWQAVIRYGTPDIEAKDTNAFLRLIRFCIALDFVGALAAFILAIAGLLCLNWILPYLPSFQGEAEVAKASVIVKFGIPYCLLILLHQGGVSTGLFRVFDKFLPLALQTLVMPVTRLLGAVTVLVLGAGLDGFVLAWFIGSFAGYVSLPLMAMWELKQRNLLRKLFAVWPTLRTNRQGIWPFVWKANIDSSLATGTTHLPVLLVMPIFGTAFVSIYKVADDIAKLLSEAMLLLDRVIYPEYARMMHRGQSAEIWKLVLKTAAILLAFGLACAALPAFLGPYVIPWVFGYGYAGAVALSVLLVVAAAVMGVAAPLYPVFFASGKPELAIIARILGLVVYIGLIFSLSAAIGKTGPGWAAIFGNIFAVIVAVFLAKRTLKSVNPG